MIATPPVENQSPILEYLQYLHREFSDLNSGNVATYIPELARANPDWFGICIVTANGNVYETGDSRQLFTIQSISKPFVYGLALEDNGRSAVLNKVGVEPTGDAFNSISLDPATGRPRNPMINAGAIATAGLIGGKSQAIRSRRIVEMLGLYAGRELSIDDTVYKSESETGHRNRAIGHMLRNFEILSSDPTPTVEVYFQQCSVAVNCRDLGIMAATLANRGLNPLTGKQAIRGEYVENVLSVMGSCGMYNSAGEWIYDVGMPAKSGVSGGVIAVLPGQLGIAVFSPRLDPQGNSVRGVKICNEISRHLDLHLFNRPTIGRLAVRLKFTGADLNSSRISTAAETAALREHGQGIKVYQLQGNLNFSTVEVLVHDLIETMDKMDQLVLDFRRVLSINESACRAIYDMLLKLSNQNKPVVFVQIDHLPLLRRLIRIKSGARFSEIFREFDDLDPALESCEERLLAVHLPENAPALVETPSGYDLLKSLTVDQVALIAGLLKRRTYKAGETIIEVGAEANELFLLTQGKVSVVVTLASGTRKRLATFSSGMTFGEMAILDRAPRSAMIIAITDVVCDVLPIEAFDRLDAIDPVIKIKILKSLSLDLCRKLRKANRELTVLG